MKLTTPFNGFRNATSDISRMPDLNYKLPKKATQDYWDKECIDYLISAHCKVY